MSQALRHASTTTTSSGSTYFGANQDSPADIGSGSCGGAQQQRAPVEVESSDSEQLTREWYYPTEDLEDSEASSNFDQACWDDDEEPLLEDGEILIPCEPDQEYKEEDALYLRNFAVTYQQVQGALQASRTGREQRTYRKLFAKGKSKGARPPRSFQKGQPPRKKNFNVRTPFKDKARGKPTRKTWDKFKSNVVCFKCGKKRPC